MQKSNIIGHVGKGASNRYWQFGLSEEKSNLLVTLFWFVHICLIFLYSLFLATYLRLRYGRPNTIDLHTNEVLDCLPLFLDIYPTCTYPPVIKAEELAYFKRCSFVEPTLELGAGDGFFTVQLYKGRDDKVTIASDLIGSTLVQAEKYGFWRKLALMDATKVALPDNSVSTVIMNNLIHHLPDRKEVLTEMYRILRPDGVFIFTDEFRSWATSQWYIKIRKGFRSYQKNLDKFLNRSIQNLLGEVDLWDIYLLDDRWKMCETKYFFSNKSMFLSSFLESLNRKLGAPSPKPIRDILDKLPLLKKAQLILTKQIVEALIIKDEEWCGRYGATSVFVVLKKRGSSESIINKPDLVCPVCKSELVGTTESNYCRVCGKRYPFFEDIPILIPYYDSLPKNVFDSIDGRVVPDVSC